MSMMWYIVCIFAAMSVINIISLIIHLMFDGLTDELKEQLIPSAIWLGVSAFLVGSFFWSSVSIDDYYEKPPKIVSGDNGMSLLYPFELDGYGGWFGNNAFGMGRNPASIIGMFQD